MLDWLISSHHPKPNPVSFKLPAQHPLTCFQLESVIHVYNAIGCFLTLASCWSDAFWTQYGIVL